MCSQYDATTGCSLLLRERGKDIIRPCPPLAHDFPLPVKLLSHSAISQGSSPYTLGIQYCYSLRSVSVKNIYLLMIYLGDSHEKIREQESCL